MLDLIRHSGFVVWLVLLFGAMALVTAVLFARRPDDAKLGALRALTLTVVFTMFAAFTAGVGKSIAGLHGLPPNLKPSWALFVAYGSGEALGNIVLGCTLLALAWFIAVIGFRRIARGE
jgi:hypothetical protein